MDDAFALGAVNIASRYWQPQPMVHVYSNVALAYTATHQPSIAVEFLLELRRLRPVAFVGNRNVSPHLLRAIFGSQVL